ncbi:MAG TPA: LacI family DNA-binding transcriptional regulator [Solirubrobacterales bacterium]|nr:LacI family DNA-binding transcriptional regulator [Solirubrobacterales bacterium]
MERRPSIRDLAEATGVSAATVSLALRDKGRMSEETRSRIKRAAAESGYVPNSTARSLAGGRTQLISISMPAIGMAPEVVSSVEYFFKLLGGAAAKALELDHGLLVASPSERPDRVAVDGAVVVDPSVDDPTVAAFDRLGRPVVTIGRRLDERAGDQRTLVVDNDYISATERMLDHLRDGGSHTIALVGCHPIDSFQRDSIDTHRAWCERHGLTARVVMSESPRPEHAALAARELVAGPDRPEAVYATIDTLAEAVLEEAAELGVAVPGEMRVATCSDGYIARSSTPALTTIDEKPVELGEAAVEMLIAAILDPDMGSASVQIGTDLVIRASTA